MRKIAYLFSSTAIVALALLSSCKKDKEPTPDENPEAPVVTATMTANNEGLVTPSLDVTTSTGTAKIRLDVTYSSNLSKIYIMKSEDNSSLAPLTAFGSITTSDGKTFASASSDYSFDIPSGTANFILDVPVTVRTNTTAVTDVYYIWITDGNGSFLKSDKNKVLGAAVVTLKYTSAAVTPFATATLNVGTQSAANASFLVTSGQVSALSTADYTDSPGSADIRFVSLTSGNKDNLSADIFMYSPADVPTTGAVTAPEFTVATGSNATKFGSYAGDFDAATGAQIAALTAPTATNIEIAAGSTYVFKTAAGKLGLIKINSLTADTDATNAGGYNAEVKIKVLN